ncbi:MAG: ABC transporter ATP-binding protein [Desulfarculus sp.]|jgi:peptide/nickel transport system ATP-binding protein|nr:MAG: ABC transporter ATP-binding protein [Desulfarculus sp.]
MPLLSVENLCIGYRTAQGLLKAVEGVNFTLEAGSSLGLVGESGCGKTTIGMALMGLLPPNGRISEGRIVLDGVDLAALSEEELRAVRWRDVAMIFQAAMNALNPVQRVSRQMTEAISTHRPELGKEELLGQVEGLFQLVGLPLARLHDYPHQYSGGMKQRAIIAMALALNPKLIIADEPTTALDVVVQDQILKETKALQDKFHMGIIFISHDISIVAEVCQHIGVMYAGQLVESGSTEQVFYSPRHPYTMALVNSFPTLTGERKELTPIPGEPPNLIGVIPGCRFCDRCPRSEAFCKLEPPSWQEVAAGHRVLCDHC